MFCLEVSDSDSLRGIDWLHCIWRQRCIHLKWQILPGSGDNVVSKMMNFAQQMWKAAFAVVPFADLSLDIHRSPLPQCTIRMNMSFTSSLEIQRLYPWHLNSSHFLAPITTEYAMDLSNVHSAPIYLRLADFMALQPIPLNTFLFSASSFLGLRFQISFSIPSFSRSGCTLVAVVLDIGQTGNFFLMSSRWINFYSMSSRWINMSPGPINSQLNPPTSSNKLKKILEMQNQTDSWQREFQKWGKIQVG